MLAGYRRIVNGDIGISKLAVAAGVSGQDCPGGQAVQYEERKREGHAQVLQGC